MFLATLLGGCLVHWHWKASLISHLSVVIPHNPFSSLEELLLSSYQITILGSSSYQIDFEGAESGLFRDLWLTKFSDSNKSLTRGNGESTQVALNSHYTHYVDYTSARNTKAYHECKLTIANFFVRKVQLAFAFPKNSPYLSLFNSQLQSMFESGEIMKIIIKHSKGSPSCETQKGKPLGFENISLMFLILSFGAFLSVVTFAMEVLLPKKNFGMKNNVDKLLISFSCRHITC